MNVTALFLIVHRPIGNYEILCGKLSNVKQVRFISKRLFIHPIPQKYDKVLRFPLSVSHTLLFSNDQFMFFIINWALQLKIIPRKIQHV